MDIRNEIDIVKGVIVVKVNIGPIPSDAVEEYIKAVAAQLKDPRLEAGVVVLLHSHP